MQTMDGPRAAKAIAVAGMAALLLGACATGTPRNPPAPVATGSTATPVPGTWVVRSWPPAAPASAPPAAGGPPSPPPSAGPPPLPPTAVPSPPTPAVVSAPAESPAVAARFPEPPVTFATPAFEAGRTAFTTNAELGAIVRGLARNGGGPGRTAVDLLPLGASQRGVPIEALAFTRPPPPPAVAATTAPARRPAVLLISGQHGDEPAGTEALIVVMQDLAAGRFDRVLDRVDVFVLPRVNPDGAALGQRAAADGIDVNRDHLLLRSPEAAAEAQLVRDVAPMVVLDLHEYPVDSPAWIARFGAVRRADALLQHATAANIPPFVTKAADEWFRAPLAAGLASAGFTTDWYHTASSNPADRKVSMGGVGAQIGRNASGLKNAVSLLVETRGGGLGRTDLKRRVQAHVTAVANVLGSAAARAADLAKLREFVERDVAATACQGEALIDVAPTPSEYNLQLLDPQTGAVRRVAVAWDSALELTVRKSRPRPCGYWLAAGESDAVRRLRLLGVEVQQLDAPGDMRGETYRETGREAPVDGAVRLRVQTAPVLLDVAAGSYYVSMEQPMANLAIAALEPESPSGYAANGVIAGVGSVARILGRPSVAMTSMP